LAYVLPLLHFYNLNCTLFQVIMEIAYNFGPHKSLSAANFRHHSLAKEFKANSARDTS